MQSAQTSTLLKAARPGLTRRLPASASANSASALPPPGPPPRCLHRVASFATCRSGSVSACSNTPRGVGLGLGSGQLAPASTRARLSPSLASSASSSWSLPLSTTTERILHLPRRPYTTSSPSSTSSPPTVFADPHRPDLFYHLVHAPRALPASYAVEGAQAYALSFLRETPPSADSAVVLGWLPAQTHASSASGGGKEGEGEGKEAGLGDFRENPKFLALLHASIKSALQQGLDEIWINAAIQYQNGWMHIHDQRNIPALDRIGDSEDIIASVFVENGVMNLATYAPMPSYRLCTADGITQLTPGLARYLLEELGRVRT